MKLYHFTKNQKFRLIWNGKKLRFSEWTTTNDLFERGKVFRLTKESAESNGVRCDTETFRQFRTDVFNEIQKYKQISFCKDYKICEGFASPMMWGHYAYQVKKQTIQSGVCVEIDSDKLKIGQTIYKDDIKYTDKIESTHLKWIDTSPSEAAQLFVLENLDKLFFTKHSHWEHENEYRLISKEDEFLDIAEAITAIYVLWEDHSTLNKVKRMVKDKSLIKFLEVGGLGQVYMKSNRLDWYEEDVKLLNRLNKKN